MKTRAQQITGKRKGRRMRARALMLCALLLGICLAFRPAAADEKALSTILSYAEEVAELKDVSCLMDEGAVRLSFDVREKDGLRIFTDILQMVMISAVAAPQTKTIVITLRHGRRPVARIRVATRAVLQYVDGKISEAAFFRRWQREDLLRPSPRRVAATQSRASSATEDRKEGRPHSDTDLGLDSPPGARVLAETRPPAREGGEPEMRPGTQTRSGARSTDAPWMNARSQEEEAPPKSGRRPKTPSLNTRSRLAETRSRARNTDVWINAHSQEEARPESERRSGATARPEGGGAERAAETTELSSQPRMVLRADLNGDGRQERVLLIPARTRTKGCYTLLVQDAEGRLIWREPVRWREAQDSPFLFCEVDTGISLPEVLGDIDGDGAVELVAPAPQSDVAPTLFRVLRWRHGAFYLAQEQFLMADPSDLGAYSWRDSVDYEGEGRWVESFLLVIRPGLVRARIYDTYGEHPQVEDALLQANSHGYDLVKWLTNPLPPRVRTVTSRRSRPLPESAGNGESAECDRLWYERNAIFARKGRCFTTERARRAFPDSCFPPYGRLTPGEKRRVRRILQREQALGCR